MWESERMSAGVGSVEGGMKGEAGVFFSNFGVLLKARILITPALDCPKTGALQIPAELFNYRLRQQETNFRGQQRYGNILTFEENAVFGSLCGNGFNF